MSAGTVWNLCRVLIWALVAIVLAPNLLAMAGWDDAYRWIRAHAWVRWLAVPVLGPLFLLTVLEFRARPRPSHDRSPLPRSLAPREAPAAVDATLGLRDGDAIRWPVEGQLVETATWSAKGQRRCVAVATLRDAPDFYFSARSARAEPAWMRGAAQHAIRIGLGHGRRDLSTEQAETIAALEFMWKDPIDMTGTPHGARLVLRSNRPGQARELLSDAELVRVLGEIEQAGRRWELSLMPGGSRGESRLVFECPGRADDARNAAWAKALMTAALVRLAPPVDRERTA